MQLLFDVLTCERSADWWGGSEPYLWTVFFKIDGATVKVLNTTQLSGKGTIASNIGSHGNLEVAEMNTGDVAFVPPAVGLFENTLIPIPVDPPLSSVVPDASGVVGAAVTLWEEDDFPAEAANIGYDQFAIQVEWAMQEIIKKRNLASMEPTPKELEEVQNAVNAGVAASIRRYLISRSWLGNQDDVLGFELFRFSHDSFGTAAFQPFSKRWSGEDGDWVLSGQAVGVPPCPVSAVLEGLGPRAGELRGADEIQAAMRLFRDQIFPNNPRLGFWWSILEKRSASLAVAVRKSQELQNAMLDLFADVHSLLLDPGKSIDAAMARRADMALQKIGETADKQFSRELAKIRPLLSQVEGKTLVDLALKVSQTDPN
ncbi:MAG TPA: hypothetical protein VF762_10920 [Blastocatellia bacterium]